MFKFVSARRKILVQQEIMTHPSVRTERFMLKKDEEIETSLVSYSSFGWARFLARVNTARDSATSANASVCAYSLPSLTLTLTHFHSHSLLIVHHPCLICMPWKTRPIEMAHAHAMVSGRIAPNPKNLLQK